MNRFARLVKHTAIATVLLASIVATLALLPGESWAQQLVRAQITNTTLAVTQSGTWTVQPGNTANTTAWLVTGTGGTFPATQSGSWSVTADTELVAVAALADNTANPTISGLAAYMMCFDGTTWDRCQAALDATQGSTILANGPQVMFEAINFDGSASPTTVTEGQSIRPKATTSGIGMALLTSADGSVSPQATIGSTPLLRVALFDDANNQITAFGGSGGTSSNFGAGFPTPGTAAGFSDGTNMQGARVGDLDTDGGTFYALWAAPCVGTTAGCAEPAYGAGALAATVQRFTLATDDQLYTVFGADAIFGTAGTADADVLSVQGVASMTPLLVNPGTAANWAILADEGDFTYTTSTVQAFGAVAESTTDAIADGKLGVPVMTLARTLRTTPTGYLGGGGVPVNMISDASDNEDETAICTGPCTVYSIVAFNHTAASAFLRCENDTAGNTTPGSEANADGEFDLEIPASTTGAGFVYNVGGGIGASFSTALTCWIVSEEAATGTTDVAANDVRAQFIRVQ